MALNIAIIRQLARRMKPGQRVAAFGYPDITASEDEVAPLLEGKSICYREDSEAICKRHGLPNRPIPDADSFFGAFDVHLDVYDVIQERGNEILCDLNFPMAVTTEYDYVLDVGTMEHCFNIGQAMMNMAGMVRQGGMIFHENPFIMPNHGFWSVNPTVYADFYEQNGFELVGCSARVGRLGSDEIQDVPIKTRFSLKADMATLMAAAIRNEVQPLKFAVQSKYKSVILAAAGNRAI